MTLEENNKEEKKIRDEGKPATTPQRIAQSDVKRYEEITKEIRSLKEKIDNKTNPS